MNTEKVLLFAALGLGAYMLVSRRATAGTLATTPAAAAAATAGNGKAELWGKAGALLGGLLGKIGGASASTGGTTAIANNDVPGQPGYGWQYFSDGTSISPTGSYYSGGSLVWSPPQDSTAVNPVGGFDNLYQDWPKDFIA